MGSETCDATANNRCFKSNRWTLPAALQNVSRSDLTVLLDDKDYTNFTIGKYTSVQEMVKPIFNLEQP